MQVAHGLYELMECLYCIHVKKGVYKPKRYGTKIEAIKTGQLLRVFIFAVFIRRKIFKFFNALRKVMLST